VLFAHGSRFGGHALFVKDRKLFYVNSFIGVPPEQSFVSEGVVAGKRVLGMEFVRESVGERHESHGTTRLYIDDKQVAEGPMRTQPGHYALCGEGLSIGRDTGAPVSVEYQPPFAFTGGRIIRVEFALGDDQYLDLEAEAAAMMARE
jgi:arylsulfatase